MKIIKYNKTISIFISIILSLIYFLYNSRTFTIIPCDQEFSSKFLSNFIHTNSIHLISNLLGLYFISELENQIGSSNFLNLVILISLIMSFFETIFKSGCSIGFSGILYGLVAYEMFKFKNIDYNVIYTLILLFLFSGNSKISHTGHLLGFISGLISTCLL